MFVSRPNLVAYKAIFSLSVYSFSILFDLLFVLYCCLLKVTIKSCPALFFSVVISIASSLVPASNGASSLGPDECMPLDNSSIKLTSTY